jgi:type II secretory pathway component PulF
VALYYYEAFLTNGKKVKGTLDAPSINHIKEQLVSQKLLPIIIRPATLESSNVFMRLFAKKVSLKDKILFTKQLTVLLRSGITLLQSLELLVDQFTGSFHAILVAIKDDLKQGSSLAAGMSQYPRTFETIYVQLVRAGEASGQLEVILERLTEYLERQDALQKRISGALRDPLMQLGLILLIVVGMLVFVVPNLVEAFVSQGKALPMPTRILLFISNFLMNHYVALAGFLFGSFALFTLWKSTARGKRILDEVKLKIPVVKFLSRTNAVVQFCYTLGLLLEGGVHVSEALDIVVKIIDNQILADAISVARDKIIKQGKIAQYLKQSKIFPSVAIYLIETGEESGQLDKMLLTVAKNYETEVMELTDKLTEILKPIMSIFMAVVVGFIIFAIALPMMQMGDLAGV